VPTLTGENSPETLSVFAELEAREGEKNYRVQHSAKRGTPGQIRAECGKSYIFMIKTRPNDLLVSN
jgi:hypothetical protein